MALSRDEVKHIAMLAKLSLTEEEIDMYAEQLSEILGYFDLLQELDTEDIQPTSTILSIRTVLRDDVPEQHMSRDELLENAADRDEVMFRVKAVLD